MSKINQIEQKLQEIDATRFHKLLDAYITKKLSYPPHSNGTKLGEDKPSNGTPDSYIALEDGQYIFIEYTTQKTGIKAKFMTDLEKCFEEIKTGIPVGKIKKIILACNSDLSPRDVEQFKSFCDSKNTECEFLGNSQLSNDLFCIYPNIAKEFLDISIDTEQILDYADFIKAYEANKYSTSLNTTLQFRETETQQLKELLTCNQVTFITGVAGVGKTKFTLDVGLSFAQENGFTFKVILNRGADIFDDMKAYFNAESEPYLVFIDDVNRIKAALEYFISYYGEKIKKGSLKVVATVRDYAKDNVFDSMPNGISRSEIELKPLKDDSIKKIIEKEYGISSHIFLERISDVSQGNPRLAMMAASVAKEQNKLEAIYNVTSLYDIYFSSVKKDVEAFKNSDLLLCFTIISFFRFVDKENERQNELIKEAFHVSVDELWKSVEELHRLEIVDLYENNVVKVSNQILSTYLFYKTVFVDKKIKIDIFLEFLFLNFKERFIDILNPILSSFDKNLIFDSLREPVNTLWNKCLTNEQDIYEVMNVFWFLKQTDILIYFSQVINGLEGEAVDDELLDVWKTVDTNKGDEVLKKLSLLGHDSLENIKMSIELIIEYLKKKPSKIYEVIATLTESFGYKDWSYQYGYSNEKLLIDTLWKYADNGQDKLLTKLFIVVASWYLKTEFEENRMKGASVTIKTYKLFETEELKILRNGIFEKIDVLFSQEEYLKDLEELISRYPLGISFQYGVSEVEKWDVQNILNLAHRYFDINSYKHCKIVQNLFKSLNRHQFVCDTNATTIKDTFKHRTYELEKLLLLNILDISFENPKGKAELENWDELKQNIQDRLSSFIQDYQYDDWVQLLDSCRLICLKDNRESYNFKNNLSDLFHILAEKDANLYAKVLKKYLELGDPILLGLNMPDIINIFGKEGTFELLNKYSFLNRERWIFSLFINIDESQISSSDVNRLMELYKTADFRAMPNSLDYLIKYFGVQNNIFLDVIKTVLERAESEDKKFIYAVLPIFSQFSQMFQYLDDYIHNDTELLEKAYLSCLDVDGHFDYDMTSFNKIINFDAAFAKKYITHIFKNNKLNSSHDINGDFSNIWEKGNGEDIFFQIIESVYDISREQHIWGGVLKAFFVYTSEQSENNDKVDNLLKRYINRYFDDDGRMIFIFQLICEFSDDRKVDLIAHLLEKNNSFELFDKLPISPTGYSWSGSLVPLLQKKMDYYSSLLLKMTTISLLRHKQKIQKYIDDLKSRIKDEKRVDFIMEDY